jgi:hypothetical protein
MHGGGFILGRAEEAWQMMIDHLVRYLGRAGAAV